MKVLCPSCEAVFTLADERLPLGKTVRVTCLKCGGTIHVRHRDQGPDAAPAGAADGVALGAVAIEDEEDLEARRFDCVEAASPAALVSLHDLEMVQFVTPVLVERGFHLRVESDSRSACRWWEQNDYAVVVIDDQTNSTATGDPVLLEFAHALAMQRRRETLLCLISASLQTMDGLRAFQLGVELIIHRRDIERLPVLLDRALAEQKAAYALYRQVGKENGLF